MAASTSAGPAATAGDAPVVLFGAVDRHNLGDLLFPHLAAAWWPGRDLRVAGLAARDLRPVGGHRVEPLADVQAALAATARAAGPGRAAPVLAHVGGELLTCPAWQAAVMLLPEAEVAPVLAGLAADPAGRAAWARARLGTAAQAPYVVGRDRWPRPGRLLHLGVGGVDLADAPAPLRAEVLAALREAEVPGVRDHRTLAALQVAGLPARLVPDPVLALAARFGDRIRARAAEGELAAWRRRLAEGGRAGHAVVQVSAEFADDASLAALAAPLAAAARAQRWGIALLRVGAAPWHDDAAVLDRLAARLAAVAGPAEALPIQRVHTLDIWDLCAWLAEARLVCASSLHARLVAMAFAVPRVSLRPCANPASGAKLAAFCTTWQPGLAQAVVPPGDLGPALAAALAEPADTRAADARRWAAETLSAHAALVAGT